MKGDELLAYIRYRREAMGDLARIERQKEVLIKLAEKARNLDLFQIASIFSSLRKSVSMNVDIGELVYLSLRLKRNMNIGFAPFPYVINKDGDVVVDQGKVDDYRNTIASLKVPETISPPKILLINCSSDKSRGFLARSQDLWNQKVNLLPSQILWEDVGISSDKDTVMVLNKAKEEEIRSIVKAVYPNYDFVFKIPTEAETFAQYLFIIKKMAENRIYPTFPYDGVVMVTR